MKVLYNTYPTAFHTPGGGEKQLYEYKKYLQNVGVNARLFNQWKPNFLDNDLVHFFSVVGGSIHFCDFVKKTLKMPLVITSSLWITEETKDLYPCKEIRDQLSYADCIIGNSNIECENLSSILNLPRSRFKTIYNGVNDIFYNPVAGDLFRSEFGLDRPFVLNMANIEPRKNQLRLAEAMLNFPEYDLVIAGYIRDEVYAKQVLEKNSNIKFVGSLEYGSELQRSAYTAADYFCLPSLLETPGMAALEAAACGTPLIITKEGATREYFGANAVYVDPADVKSISDGIGRAISSRLNINHHTANLLNWSAVAGALKQLYLGVIESED